MVISEKPSAAKRIAQALDENGTPIEVKKRKTSYFECKRNGDTLIVVYALGHLFELKQKEAGWKYPRLEMDWVPKYEVVKKDTATKSIINLIRRLSKDIDRFIVATDYDLEGSLVGYLTLMYACRTDPSKAHRMLFSTLTKTDLDAAYENVSLTLNFPMIEAACIRHEVDWLYGINFTRALTLSIKTVAGWFKIVSTGRVQGPTLAFVGDRDRQRKVFVPVPYWTIAVRGVHDGEGIELEYSKKRLGLWREAQNIVEDLKNQTATVDSINKKKTTQQPPVPFNLSTLQSESYRHFKFKPSRTLAIAQKLYLDALISYPRTNSQKIPESVKIKEILEALGGRKKYSEFTNAILKNGNLIPVQGDKDDPAHPAIHPTGNKPTKRLTPSENKVYDLIVRRFLVLFGDAAVREIVRADISCNDHTLYLRGLRIIKPGWMYYYGPYATTKEKLLPPIYLGDEIQIDHVVAEDRYSTPPSHFNHSSLLKLLEKENLGTKATRAGIVDSVRSRGYTLNDQFEMSSLGYAILETLEDHLPKVLSPEFTRQLESQMDGIMEGIITRENVLSDSKILLLDLLENFQSQEEVIGQALVAGLQRYWKASEELGSCPKCKDGTLIVVRAPKSGKRFVGCTNYREGKCDQTFPLPQKGTITPLDELCPHCGFQMIKVASGRRKWQTCVNWTNCPGRQEGLKALEERRTKAAAVSRKGDESQ
ncbi:MAG: DNA topoisomerase I [Candidatus Thorarchaeota archaeon]|jgi:DNA topoisomerase-1